MDQQPLLKVADNRCCFICGPRNPIGLKVKPVRDAQAGTASLTVTIPAEFQGWEGIAHGGIVAALLDEVAAYAGMAVSTQIVTAELNVRYLKPVPTGVTISVNAKIRETLRRSVWVDAALEHDGVVLARAEARMMILKTPPAAS
jgi:uncharacterized protein (TIGR00369 family)